MSLASRYPVAHGNGRDFSSNPDFFSAPYHQHAAPDQDPMTRQDTVSRRESRLGLRGFFGRSKAVKENAGRPPYSHSGPMPPTHRASLAELSRWPKTQHPDAAAPSPRWRQQPQPPPQPQPGHGDLSDDASTRKRRAHSKPPKDSLANWSMPPLFKAFPQAVRHITLPAATMSADAILRLSEKKSSAAALHDATAPHDGDHDRRRHRRNASVSAEKLEWTTKIYILVTSGYLLQYAGDGHFDRLPEKMVRLGPSSAAFATDAIPGRHWVMQVSSAAQPDGTLASESRSLFSKLPFRVDRRTCSNLLMV